ncbi:nitroreductase family protein [Flavobacterium sp. CBA20B-1]|uniref:nitroreductase family protein n=1 Tax=unclassified Flavobacterium TaxID=196869 RepID=UPI0022245DD6|nr:MULTISPECIES: nitroreductase family protein [unclassified Flavobacterium]WCM42246.1 nitroreductase family protein [Flavobacterium sp. CBA20B-1]
MKKKIKYIYKQIKLVLLKLFYSNRTLAKLYYFFFDTSFNREMFSVIQGKRSYYRMSLGQNQNKYQLVRNIHKIEKGISMKNRRSTFALDFIEETVDTYLNLRNNLNIDSQISWAKEVLNNYFDITDSNNPIIGKMKKKFVETADNFEGQNIPYKSSERVESTISYDDFLILSKRRRSVRWYQQKEVNLDLINKAIELSLQAPSACNRQPFKYYIIKDEKILRRLSKLPMGTTGYADNIPLLIAVVGDLSAYFDERDRHVIYIDSSLSAMSFILALETLGLSSCIINWPDIEIKEKKIQSILKLDNNQRVTMLISVGYADQEGFIPFSCKRDVKDAITVI